MPTKTEIIQGIRQILSALSKVEHIGQYRYKGEIVNWETEPADDEPLSSTRFDSFDGLGLVMECEHKWNVDISVEDIGAESWSHVTIGMLADAILRRLQDKV